jgi:hypothetical protein
MGQEEGRRQEAGGRLRDEGSLLFFILSLHNVMCNYFVLTSPTLLSQLWERREVEAVLAPFSQAWVGLGMRATQDLLAL